MHKNKPLFKGGDSLAWFSKKEERADPVTTELPAHRLDDILLRALLGIIYITRRKL